MAFRQMILMLVGAVSLSLLISRPPALFGSPALVGDLFFYRHDPYG
jgi:hypothetical protein